MDHSIKATGVTSARKASRSLIVTALRDEFGDRALPDDYEVLFTGVGKINATIALMQSLLSSPVSMVINFGTAGAVAPNLTGLHEITRVLQHDMLAEPIAPRGRTPFDSCPGVIESGFPGIVCATGDRFVTSRDPWMVDRAVDVVDMELFAVAAVCRHVGVPWRAFKYVSDNADESAADDWQNNVSRGIDGFLARIRGAGGTLRGGVENL